MAKLIVDDELWAIVEPLLPVWTPSPKGGQPRVADRVCLTGIPHVLKTGIAWVRRRRIPQEMGCCGMTLWNRLKEWTDAGVWPELHRVLLDRLRAAGGIDFSRVLVDSGSVRAVGAGKKRDRTPRTDASPAPSIMLSATPRARRWRPRSPAPTATTARS